MEKKEIIKEIKERINSWKEDRKRISEDKFRNYLHSQNIDFSIDDIVIIELIDLLNMIEAED